jgi:transposase
MAYSQDLRHRVLLYVKAGGSKAGASRHYAVHVDTVHKWVKQGIDHRPKKPGPKDSRKFSRLALAQAVQDQPDLMLKELAARFGVGISIISETLHLMDIRRKKNTAICTSLHSSQPKEAATLSQT